MSDPRRLLDEPNELLDEERELLRAGQHSEPPESLRAALWPSLAAKVSLSVPSLERAEKSLQPSASAASGKAFASLTLLKGALIVGALGVVGFVAVSWSRARHAPSPPAPVRASAPLVSTPPSASAVDSASSEPVTETLPVPSARAAPVVRSTTIAHSAKTIEHPPSPAASSDAREESRTVAAARDSLRAGNAAEALTLLEQARQRFGSGVLGQEREALTIEALAKSGQSAAARARGQAFLKAYAHSPYADKVRQSAGIAPD